ncbi:hypothetical protein Back11_62900 [Paenibacillus baekrokdamisoli]|uniref:DUF455 domain-containing protein n=2 Tax=Paenibacillus baekrokdamisoli TaxID=1712516 RepID=A0A3G9J9C1_9BACL|nr:hypothetical protein [Paenibacillus baekrokdamisoli]BBH24945.1 hypothetical protein Back11_62900 [Paenibacillus baekrokdamisoli]
MKTVLRDVKTASQMMRRYYRAVKETMRAMAGYLPSMKSWETRKMLARHIWLDAMHADMLRSRTLDLRYPRVDVDEDSDAHLIKLLHQLPNAATDEQFVAGIYRVIKPALLAAFKTYMHNSDPLDDAPSHLYLQRIINELEQQQTDFETIRTSTGKAFADTRWETFLHSVLAASGGIDGLDLDPGEKYIPFLSRALYQLPEEGARDESWEPAVMQVPPRLPDNWIEHRIWVAIDHANEVWASETAAALIWEYDNKPWNLYYEAARCYDEMRHAMMGEARLASMGLQIGIDYPMVPDHWRTFRQRGIGALLLLLHGLEQRGPLHKSKLKQELFAVHDFDGAQDCDYDWADESGHITYGLSWLKSVFPGWQKLQIIEETNKLLAEWREWIERHHHEGTHGYAVFLSRIEAKAKLLKTEQSDTQVVFQPTVVTK